MTFNILTDSTADLDEKWAQENKVELVGLTITLDDIAYETVGPNRLTSDRLLECMPFFIKKSCSGRLRCED